MNTFFPKPWIASSLLLVIAVSLGLGDQARALTLGSEIVSPPAGAVLTSTAVEFQWSTTPTATNYSLAIGTTAGAGNIFGVIQAPQTVGSVPYQSRQVAGLPANGITLYVTLGTFISGSWQYTQSTYTAWTVPQLAGKLVTLHTFSTQAANTGINSDGATPDGGLVQAVDGNFYGTAQAGGAAGNGAVFSVSPAGSFTTLHSFSALTSGCGADTNTEGAAPHAGLSLGADGRYLFGTTYDGGPSGAGTVYDLQYSIANGWQFQSSPLHAFGPLSGDTNVDGANSESKVASTADNTQYGTAFSGGSAGQGTLFQVTPGGVFTTLYSFPLHSTTGGQPAAKLLLATDGNFYGTATSGGANDSGALFKMVTDGTPGGTTVTPLYQFSATSGGANSDGAAPYAALVEGGDGNFYGATTTGGANGAGTLFTVTPGGALTTLYTFSALMNPSIQSLAPPPATINFDGATPTGPLLLASDGNFYGVTSAGGPNANGTVFKLVTDGTSAGSHLTVLYAFGASAGVSAITGAPANADGLSPSGILTQGSDGNLYGVTTGGGTTGSGTLFRLPMAPSWHPFRITTLNNVEAGQRTALALPNLPAYFYKGSDNNLWGTAFDGKQWSQFSPTTQANVSDWLTYQPAYGIVYYQGTDNNLWAVYWNGKQWITVQMGTLVAGHFTSGNVAGDVVADVVWNLVHYRGTDGKLWTLYWNGATWVQAALAGTANVAGNLSVDSVLHLVYYTDSKNQLWAQYFNGAQWGQAQLSNLSNVGGPLTADVGGIVYYRSTGNNGVWAAFYNAGWAQTELSFHAFMGSQTAKLYAHRLPIYLDPAGAIHASYLTGVQWNDEALSKNALFTGGLDATPLLSLIYGRREDGNVVMLAYP